MPNRVKRVNSLIKEELSKIISKDFDFSENALITLTRVEASTDLGRARAFISVIPEDKEAGVFEFLNKTVYSFQQKLNKRLNMRPVPKIIFEMEKKTREAAKIEELLEEIKKGKD